MNTEMNLKKLPVGMLKPAKYNPRKDLKPGDPAYEKIKRSLHDFGYVDPVIATSKRVMHRYMPVKTSPACTMPITAWVGMGSLRT